MPQINYKSDDTVKDAFLHSCLGKLVILAGFVVILLLIAYFTAPSEKEMTTNMEDNVMQCLQENDSIQGDPIDDYVNNIGFIFTKADTTKIFPDLIKAYRDLNRMEIYHHSTLLHISSTICIPRACASAWVPMDSSCRR